ncbi:MAG: homoserine kinase, partial [Cyclobacteriaceae bacterium]|nr:homoserine kinase [Cyclobacteriaceae bacterium]
MGSRIRIFAPATVANIGPGFDVLGLALQSIGDDIDMQLSSTSGIKIKMIGCEDLPTDPTKNVAGVALQAMLDQLDSTQGFEMTIRKNVLPGSGLGSSASSSAGAVFAANELLNSPFTKTELIQFAMAGEASIAGKPHADNVAPSLLGGVTLVRSYTPLDVVNIGYPEDLLVTVVHPQIEVKTSDSKKILRKEIP